LNVKISYLDSDAKQKIEEITLPLEVKAIAQEGPNWLLILVILVVIGFGVWKFVLKKKK